MVLTAIITLAVGVPFANTSIINGTESDVMESKKASAILAGATQQFSMQEAFVEYITECSLGL